jgi:hypothetical protein
MTTAQLIHLFYRAFPVAKGGKLNIIHPAKEDLCVVIRGEEFRTPGKSINSEFCISNDLRVWQSTGHGEEHNDSTKRVEARLLRMQADLLDEAAGKGE